MGKIQEYIRSALGIKTETKEAEVPFVPINGIGTAQQSLDKSALLEQYKGWTYAAVSKIASDCSNVEVTLNKMDANGNVEVIKQHEVLDLLDFVNPFSTYADLVETTIMYKKLAGDSFWLLFKKNNKPVEIWQYLRPDLMGVVPSKTDFIAGYTYKVPGEGNIVKFNVDDIIMFKDPNPLDPYRGVSPVKAAEFAIATDVKAKEWNFTFFNNSARPDTVFSFDEGIDETQAKQLKTQWENAHRGTAHSQRTAFISKGKVQQVGMSQKDMDFLEQRKFSRDEILAMFKVPKALLDPQELNFASAKTAKDVYYEGVIEPEMRRFVGTLNEFLLPFYGGDSLFFDFVSPREADRDMVLKSYEVLSMVGAITPNEIRQSEGFEPIEGGDDIMGVDETEVLNAEGKGKKKKYNIRVRSRSTSAEALADIKEKLRDTDAFKIKEKLVLKPKMSKSEHEKFGERYWTKQIYKLDKEEEKFKKELDKEFDRQEKQTLKQLAGKSVSDVNFDLGEETKIFRKTFRPAVTALIAFSGEDALGDLGLDGFDVDKNIQAYIMSDGLEFCKGVNETTKNKINKQIADGVANGEGTKKIAKRITGIYAEAKTSRANNIARTEVAKSTEYGTLEAWKQSEVVESKEWFTALDERVCPICMPLHGKTTKLNKDFSATDGFGLVETPPAHQQCRCVILPVTITKQQQMLNLKKKEKELEQVIQENKDKTDEAVKEVKVNAGKELEDLRTVKDKLNKIVDEQGD